eukprot:13258219-Alexandrium_andersonii.AAC.1
MGHSGPQVDLAVPRLGTGLSCPTSVLLAGRWCSSCFGPIAMATPSRLLPLPCRDFAPEGHHGV